VSLGTVTSSEDGLQLVVAEGDGTSILLRSTTNAFEKPVEVRVPPLASEPMSRGHDRVGEQAPDGTKPAPRK
jgi:hypothetical protein